jgi:hypothetical protein
MRLRFIVVATSLLLIGAMSVIVALPREEGASLFKRLVVDPVATSVREIRGDRCQISSLMARLHGFHNHAYVLRFAINREDLTRIIAAHGFKPWERVECLDRGTVRYKSSDQYLTCIDLYQNRTPGWFDLKEWTECETYFAGRDKTGSINVDVNLLLYNERCGSAYFIKWEVRM